MRLYLRLTMLIVVMVLAFNMSISAQDSTKSGSDASNVLSDDQLEGQIWAPEFPGGLDWLNTGQPFTLAHFHGKLVLLDFWSYSNISSLHVLAELQKLEEKYARELIVVGVHSAKFANEKDSDGIRAAILRHGIKHPVVNDSSLQIWNEYGVKLRPTFVLLNPLGRVIGVHAGEGVYDLFDDVIEQAVKYFDRDNRLARNKIGFVSEDKTTPRSLLNFPSKIISDSSGTRLYITDSGNNRIIALTPSGKVEFVIGSSLPGNQDGAFTEARFNRPQGLALVGNILYIADTENHTIRAADLSAKTVKTILGTGTQAAIAASGGKGTLVALSSPWDLIAQDGKLYIAMAGSHQIWVADLRTLEAKPFAGTGQMAHIDGPLLQSALAQPSGITTDGQRLYFVDSESSSIRAADLADDGNVETIIGRDLFEFGDSDGDSATARLQHPLGITFHVGQLYVADTYNNKVKIVDPVKRTASTFVGTGKRGDSDGPFKMAGLNEPSGLTFAAGRLFIADCSNHRISVIDDKAQKISALQLTNLGLLARQSMKTFAGREISLQPNKIKPGAGKISIALVVPEGYELNERAPFFVEFRSDNAGAVALTASPKEITLNKETGEFELPVNAIAGSGTVTVEIVTYFSKVGSTGCLFDVIRLNIPITVDAKGPGMFGVAVNVTAMPRI